VAIARQHRADLEAHLRDVAEAQGIELSPETFPVLLFEEWDTVVDPRLVSRKQRDRDLVKLRDDKTRTDQAAIDIAAEITRLEGQP
jgi:hypothetical protein